MRMMWVVRRRDWKHQFSCTKLLAAEVGVVGVREKNEFTRAANALIRYRDAELPEVDTQLNASIQENKEIVEGESAKIETELKEGADENVAKALLGLTENIKRENLISRLKVPYTFTRCGGLISSVLHSQANRVWDSLFVAAAAPPPAKKGRPGDGGGGANEAYDFLSKMYIHELYNAFKEIDMEQSFDTGYYVRLSAAVLACLELYENPIDRVYCFYYLLPNVETGAGFLARYIALTTVDLATYEEKMPELPKMDEIDMEEIIENARSLMDISPERLLKELYKELNTRASLVVKSSSSKPVKSRVAPILALPSLLKNAQNLHWRPAVLSSAPPKEDPCQRRHGGSARAGAKVRSATPPNSFRRPI